MGRRRTSITVVMTTIDQANSMAQPPRLSQRTEENAG
jgi:hypothetical protein